MPDILESGREGGSPEQDTAEGFKESKKQVRFPMRGRFVYLGMGAWYEPFYLCV